MTTPKSETYNMDCMELMRTLPDKHFDLSITDVPYGIDINSSGRLVKEKGREYKAWDVSAPEQPFFDEILRVSKNVIFWGANHFIDRIPINSKAWIVWDKEQPEGLSFAMCELALTTFTDKTAKVFHYSVARQNNDEERIHVTQKPVALYAWILKNYAKKGETIFDPMMGSGSSRIAAYKMGFDYTGCEIDTDFYTKSCERFDRVCRGVTNLPNGKKVQEQSLFGYI